MFRQPIEGAISKRGREDSIPANPCNEYRVVNGDRFLRRQCFAHIDEAFVFRPGLSGLGQISLQSRQPRCSSRQPAPSHRRRREVQELHRAVHRFSRGVRRGDYWRSRRRRRSGTTERLRTSERTKASLARTRAQGTRLGRPVKAVDPRRCNRFSGNELLVRTAAEFDGPSLT